MERHGIELVLATTATSELTHAAEAERTNAESMRTTTVCGVGAWVETAPGDLPIRLLGPGDSRVECRSCRRKLARRPGSR